MVCNGNSLGTDRVSRVVRGMDVPKAVARSTQDEISVDGDGGHRDKANEEVGGSSAGRISSSMSTSGRTARGSRGSRVVCVVHVGHGHVLAVQAM